VPSHESGLYEYTIEVVDKPGYKATTRIFDPNNDDSPLSTVVTPDTIRMDTIRFMRFRFWSTKPFSDLSLDFYTREGQDRDYKFLSVPSITAEKKDTLTRGFDLFKRQTLWLYLSRSGGSDRAKSPIKIDRNVSRDKVYDIEL
jgi:hypothetical protein